MAGMLALGACGGRSGDGKPLADVAGQGKLEACDPLAADSKPIELGHVIAVGQAPDGTLYVATGMDNLIEVFVSEAGALQRKRVDGTGGSGGGADADFTASFEDGSDPSRLVVKVRANKVVGIALVHDRDRSFFDDLSASAILLQSVAPSQVEKLPVRNLPGEVVLDGLATATDGSQLVLTRPRDDWSYSDFRVFYGRDGTLQERELENASRGNDTYLTFRVEGVNYDAVLASAVLSPNTPSTLRTPAGTQSLTLGDTASGLPAGATFMCLR